jgi:hypothetical protein
VHRGDAGHASQCTEGSGMREGPVSRPLDDPRRRRARGGASPP